ncbi:NAD-dependent epimerase/dehydratase family protein [Sulfurimonas sp. HSL-1716]|uniref:NAD-dependent epimerase/dehydratase family protein n=1 Tax=Hydrocurvibacter sulfurireducens TaxID=3131937 RepID=UPI0031F89219
MVKVLVTGSKGFIGKNLLKKLEDKKVSILEFNRNDTADKLKTLVLESDFICHLAGEVRPGSTEEDFKESNVVLTKAIIDILTQANKNIPILLASSIHAKLLKNEYGKTKRESEILIERYSKENSINCFIYRLPHLFGEGCKPNYNSVMSTWIYNSIKNLEINVFDRNINMRYLYVQDVVDEFTDTVFNQNKPLYIENIAAYDTTLGEVVDYINEFKENVRDTKFTIKNNEFKSKLFRTYQDYYNKFIEL